MKLLVFSLIFLILTCKILYASGSGDYSRYTNDFAVEINGDSKVADDVARAYGFKLVRHVKSLGSVYHFVHDRVSRRSRRGADDIKSILESDPNVIMVEQQKLLMRNKRSITPNHHHNNGIFPSDDDDDDDDDDGGDGVDPVVDFNDPHFKDQWYLLNRGQLGGVVGHDLNVYPAWVKGYTGKGVVVSILDDGIDHSHPDLQKNYDPEASADLNDRSDKMNDPMPNKLNPYNNHGTRCAGEVGAQANNSNCCVGVAFNSKIGGIRMLDGSVTDLLEGESLLYNNQHIDIYSASWGPNDDGRTMEAPNRYCRLALEEGTLKGRKGLGSIFVWASGNGGMFQDDCSCDGYVSSIHTLAIGSVTDEGMSTYYGEVCPSVMGVVFAGGSHSVGVPGAVAGEDVAGEDGEEGGGGVNKPEHDVKVVTTDLHGGCTLKFQGTSSAAPLAAGCIALVLEANANLTWRDVQHLVVETSVIPSEKEDGWKVNAAGYHVNHRFGFGVLDCGRMVEAAENWIGIQEQLKCVVKSQGPTRILYKDSTITEVLSTASPSSDCNHNNRSHASAIDHLEHVQIHIKLVHRRRGDVTISLTSPQETTSNILNVRPLDRSGNGIDFVFMTVHSWGENPSGNWTLTIKDNSGLRENMVNSINNPYDDGEDEDGNDNDPDGHNNSNINNDDDHDDNSGKVQVGMLLKWSLILYGVEGELKNHKKWIGSDGIVHSADGKAKGTRLEAKRRELERESKNLNYNKNNNYNIDDENKNEDVDVGTGFELSSSTSSPSSLFTTLPSSAYGYLSSKLRKAYSIWRSESDGGEDHNDNAYHNRNDGADDNNLFTLGNGERVEDVDADDGNNGEEDVDDESELDQHLKYFLEDFMESQTQLYNHKYEHRHSNKKSKFSK